MARNLSARAEPPHTSALGAAIQAHMAHDAMAPFDGLHDHLVHASCVSSQHRPAASVAAAAPSRLDALLFGIQHRADGAAQPAGHSWPLTHQLGGTVSTGLPQRAGSVVSHGPVGPLHHGHHHPGDRPQQRTQHDQRPLQQPPRQGQQPQRDRQLQQTLQHRFGHVAPPAAADYAARVRMWHLEEQHPWRWAGAYLLTIALVMLMAHATAQGWW